MVSYHAGNAITGQQWQQVLGLGAVTVTWLLAVLVLIFDWIHLQDADSPVAPAATAKRKLQWWKPALFACAALWVFLVFGAKVQRVLASPKPPPICGDSLQGDMQGLGDFSHSTVKQFDIAPTPGCFGPQISIPQWRVWEHRFVDPKAKEHGCVVWFKYPSPDRVFGPFGSDKIPVFNNFPAKWRIANNCTYRYYQEK